MKESRRILRTILFIAVVVPASVFLWAGQASAGASPCTVIIEKIAVPDDGTVFEFNVTGGMFSGFGLPSGGEFGVGIGIEGTVTVTEAAASGYTLESIECSPPDSFCGGGTPCLNINISGNGLSAECLDNDVRTCTFTNVAVQAQVPAISELGLILTAALLGMFAAVILYRKRKAEA